MGQSGSEQSGSRGVFSSSEDAGLGDGERWAVLAKQGSVYGKPARSKVRTREGTTTLRAARGLIPRTPWNVEEARLEP